MAGAASPHNALHRGIRVPDRRAGGFSPLGIPRQSKTRDDYRSPLSSIPRTRHCGRSGICQTPSRHSDADLSSVWLSICRGAPVAGPGGPHEIRGIYDTVRLIRLRSRPPVTLSTQPKRSKPPPDLHGSRCQRRRANLAAARQGGGEKDKRQRKSLLAEIVMHRPATGSQKYQHFCAKRPKKARENRREATRAPRRGVGLRGGQIPRATSQRGDTSAVPCPIKKDDYNRVTVGACM